MAAKQERPRWADAYTGLTLPESCQKLVFLYSRLGECWGANLTRQFHAVPGQFVAIKREGEGAQGPQPTATRLHALASSPYAVHRESADLDASIIEVHNPFNPLKRALENDYPAVR